MTVDSLHLTPYRALLDEHHRHVTFAFVAMSDCEHARPTQRLRRLEVLDVRRFPLADLPMLHKGTKGILESVGFYVVEASGELPI